MSILYFQSDVMQLTDDSTKLKLFMDVLDGAKATVSFHGIKYFFVLDVLSFLVFISLSYLVTVLCLFVF